MKKLSVALVLIIAAATVALGHSQYVQRIPNGSVFRCDNCHNEHKFQQDFKNNGLKWDKALAVKDSDGDGASNGVELQDPDGKWSPGKADPHIQGWSTYNPDDRTSTPPYAAVEPVSMGRVKALYR